MAGNGGKRAGAGRKPIVEEGRMADLIGKSIDITDRFLSDESIPLERRSEIAARVVAKRIPTDMNVSGNLTHNIFILEAISKSGMTND